MPYPETITHWSDPNTDLDTVPPGHPHPYTDAYKESYTDAYAYAYANADPDDCDDCDPERDGNVPLPNSVPIR